MKHGSLFSGIGGFDLAAEWMGWENIFHCEWNDFGKRILKYYWPKAINYNDITKTDFTIHRGTIDILSGGFPCQPYSGAWKRKGTADNRHLWPEMLRAIREIQPSFIVGENVRGLTNWNGGLVFDQVQAEMEAQGYEVLPFLLPACAVNAPHRRDRIWFIAYNKSNRRKRGTGKVGSISANASSIRFQGRCIEHGLCKKPGEEFIKIPYSNSWENFPSQSPVCNGDDGISSQLDGITFSKWRKESIKGGGNAIVPQVAYEIFKAIRWSVCEEAQQKRKKFLTNNKNNMIKIYSIIRGFFAKRYVKRCGLCGDYQAKGKELTFISWIKRDGSGTDYITKENDMRHLDDTTFNINGLSLTNGTYIASEFNSYVVRFKTKD